MSLYGAAFYQTVRKFFVPKNDTSSLLDPAAAAAHHIAYRSHEAFSLQVADFGLSRQAIASKVETATYGTGAHSMPILTKGFALALPGSMSISFHARKSIKHCPLLLHNLISLMCSHAHASRAAQ